MTANVSWVHSCIIAAALRIYYVDASNKRVWQKSGRSLYYGATQEFIWAHIEPSCSILAACLPTYAPLFAGNKGLERCMEYFVNANRTMGRWVSSLTSLNSYGRRSSGNQSRENSRGRGGNASDDESLVNSVRDRHLQKAYIPELQTGDNYQMVTITGGTGAKEGDLEAQRESSGPLKIAVKKAFGTEQGKV